MKPSRLIRLLFPLLLALLLPLAVLPINASSERQSATVTALSEYRGTYRQKEAERGMTSYAVSNLLWNNYITPLAQHVDPTEEQIHLYAQKAYAVAPLAWIYYSHPELHPTDGSSNTVSAEYLVQKARIDGQTVPHTEEEQTASERFFREEVKECYTKLLNTIYAEKILGLAQAGDSQAVTEMICTAAEHLLFPDPLSPQITYETEDAENYKAYLSGLAVSVDDQRNRDAVSTQLLSVYRMLYGIDADRLAELTDPHVTDFLEMLSEKGSVSSVNELLRRTVDGLLSDLAANHAPYAKEYLSSTLKNHIFSAIAAATSNGAVADLSDCLSAHPQSLKRAQYKDALTLHTEELLLRLPKEQHALLRQILSEYVTRSGYLDQAETLQALETQRTRAEMRVFWLEETAIAMTDLGKRTDCFLSSYADPLPFRLRIEQIYHAVDQAIAQGERDSSPALSADRTRLRDTVREGEADAFRKKHCVLLEEPPEATEKKQEWLNAIRDSDLLSPEAKELLGVEIMQMKQAWEALTRTEILHALEIPDEGDPAKKHQAALLHALTELCMGDSPRLSVMAEQAALLTLRADWIGQVFDAYRHAAETAPDYAEHLLDLADRAAESIRMLSEDRISAKASYAIARLCAIEHLMPLKEYASHHRDTEKVAELLRSAEALLLSDLETLPDDPADFCDDLLFRMRLSVELQDKEKELAEEQNGLLSVQELTDAEKNAYLAQADSILHRYREAIDQMIDEDTHASAAKERTRELESALAAIREAVSRHREGQTCRANAESELLGLAFLTEDRRAAYREKILQAYRDFSEQMTGAADTDGSSLSRLKTALQALQTQSANENLAAAKRAAEAKITDAYHALLQNESYYSPSDLDVLKDLLHHAVQEIADTVDPALVNTLTPSAERAIGAMRNVPLQRIYTADGILKDHTIASAPDGYSPKEQGYSGALSSENGLPYTASLTVGAEGDVSILNTLRELAKNGKITLRGQHPLPSSIRRSLQGGTLLATLRVSADDRALGDYTLSLLMPRGFDHREIVGVIRFTEDGGAVFYEVTSREDLISFAAEGASEFYLLGQRTVNLLPVILLLALLVAAEIGVLVTLYLLRYLRNKRNRDQAHPHGSVTAIHALPLIVLTLYRPTAGILLTVALGGAAVGLAVWLTLLLRAEKRSAQDVKQCAISDRPPIPEKPCVVLHTSTRVATVTEEPREERRRESPPSSAEEPLLTVTATEAEQLMSDVQATEHPSFLCEARRIHARGKRAEINVDTVSRHFCAGDTVSLSSLKNKGLIPKNAAAVKILARGTLDKPLTVCAQDFSMGALKMILLTGGTPRITDPTNES